MHTEFNPDCEQMAGPSALRLPKHPLHDKIGTLWRYRLEV
jgi:hypothetical protein